MGIGKNGHTRKYYCFNSKYCDVTLKIIKMDAYCDLLGFSRDYLNDVRTAAKGFIALGLERYHAVCILGFNTPEWFVIV